MNYPGGKGGVFKKLINFMPAHEVYIETHLGGGAIMRNKRRARHNIGIEIDPNVIELWTKNNQIDFELIHDDAIHHQQQVRWVYSSFSPILLYLCSAGLQPCFFLLFKAS